MKSDGLAAIDAEAEGYDEIVIDLGGVTGDAPEPLPPAEAWEAFEGVLWAYALAGVRQDVTEALGDLEEAVRDGRRPTPSQVRQARLALEQAEQLVEEQYAPLAGEAVRGP